MAATRILVVEDEFLIALDIAGVLEQAGIAVIGPAGDLMNRLGLTLGDQGTERVRRAGAFYRSGVHGLSLRRGGGK